MSEHENEERMFREGLQQVAEGADVSVPVAALARAAAGRRRTGRVVMAVAAVSVAAVSVAGFVVSRDDPREAAEPPVVDQPSEPVAATGWRTEYWHDMQVDVPANWGWGTAPTKQFGGGPYLCGGPGAMVMADGSREVNAVATVPYVGRPIMISDACTGGDVLNDPKAPYVWLDADVDVGVVEVGLGYTQETVVVNGSRLTVATQDPDLRQQILASATGGETCTSRLDKAPSVKSILIEGMGEVTSAQVCAYHKRGGALDLVYATTLDADQAAAYQTAAYDAPHASGPVECGTSYEFAIISVAGTDPYGSEPVWQDNVVNVACAHIEVTPGEWREMTPDSVRPWIANGLPAILSGPTGGKGAMIDSFIGMLG